MKKLCHNCYIQIASHQYVFVYESKGFGASLGEGLTGTIIRFDREFHYESNGQHKKKYYPLGKVSKLKTNFISDIKAKFILSIRTQ